MNLGERFECLEKTSLRARGADCKLGSAAGFPAGEELKMMFRSTGVMSGVEDMAAVTFSTPGVGSLIEVESVSS